MPGQDDDALAWLPDHERISDLLLGHFLQTLRNRIT
jgi:hypothetical protein